MRDSPTNHGIAATMGKSGAIAPLLWINNISAPEQVFLWLLWGLLLVRWSQQYSFPIRGSWPEGTRRLAHLHVGIPLCALSRRGCYPQTPFRLHPGDCIRQATCNFKTAWNTISQEADMVPLEERGQFYSSSAAGFASSDVKSLSPRTKAVGTNYSYWNEL